MNTTDGSAPTFEQACCIAADHPSLPGHFPGHPLVPGVILLEHVAAALRAWRGERLARIVEVKFVASLLPSQSAIVRLALALAPAARAPAADVAATDVAVTDVAATDPSPVRIRFEIVRDTTLLARGIVEGAS